MNEIYGYIRVSTKEQCEERQLIALREFPVSDENIFMDRILTAHNIKSSCGN